MIRYDESFLLTSVTTEAAEESWCACNSGRIRPIVIEETDHIKESIE